jgi:hypothetical protein
MEEQCVFKLTAFKHGITEADIRKAFEQCVFDHGMPGEEDKNLLIGLDRNGNPIEILYNVLDGNIINVFHAMKCRKAYLTLLDLEEK